VSTELSTQVQTPMHKVSEILLHTAIGQWKVVCMCGHESFDQTKAEAVNFHRDHVDSERSKGSK
jgi:hypothetical protein